MSKSQLGYRVHVLEAVANYMCTCTCTCIGCTCAIYELIVDAKETVANLVDKHGIVWLIAFRVQLVQLVSWHCCFLGLFCGTVLAHKESSPFGFNNTGILYVYFPASLRTLTNQQTPAIAISTCTCT